MMMRATSVLGLWLVAALACGSKGDEGSDAAAGGGNDTAADHGAAVPDAVADTLADVASPSDHPTPPPDAQDTPPAGVLFPAPPAMSCQGDAGSCDFPAPSCASPECADAGMTCDPAAWLVYYDNPRCVNGGCVWDRRYFSCEGAHICLNGGCILNVTLPAPPPP